MKKRSHFLQLALILQVLTERDASLHRTIGFSFSNENFCKSRHMTFKSRRKFLVNFASSCRLRTKCVLNKNQLNSCRTV